MRQNMRSTTFRFLYGKREQFLHFQFAFGEIIGERTPWPTSAETVVEGLARPINRRSSRAGLASVSRG